MFTESQLRNASHKRYIRALFLECVTADRYDKVLFNLTRQHKPNGPVPTYSLYRLYMNYAVKDPTEVTFAQEVFGDWEHWQLIRNAHPVKEYIGKWEEEAEIKRKSHLVSHLNDIVKNDPKNSFQAAKFLLKEAGQLRQGNAGKDLRKVRAQDKAQINSILDDKAYEEDLVRLQDIITEGNSTVN
jgi:hypothetical protein